MSKFNKNKKNNNQHQKKGNPGGNQQQTNQQKKKKTLDDHMFYIGSTKQAADFDTSYQFIINHIQKEYKQPDDIV